MGSHSHKEDLQSVVPAILEVMERHSNVIFETMGLPVPTEILNNQPSRAKSYGGVLDYGVFLKNLYEVNWDIGIAPLLQCDFNRCKTITKYIEYTIAGIPMIASDIAPYNEVVNGNNGLLAASHSEWVSALEAMVTNVDFRRKSLRLAKEACDKQFNLNKQVSDLESALLTPTSDN